MSSLKMRWPTTDMSQGTININYTLELYCRPLRTMDGSRCTNYHHVLNSAKQFDVLMSYWWFPTETRLGKTATIYMTDYTASLFRYFLVLILHPSPFWMFAECRYKFIYEKLINCAFFVEISVHTWRIEKRFPVKPMWKLYFPGMWQSDIIHDLEENIRTVSLIRPSSLLRTFFPFHHAPIDLWRTIS